jgi:hypothetical protein
VVTTVLLTKHLEDPARGLVNSRYRPAQLCGHLRDRGFLDLRRVFATATPDEEDTLVAGVESCPGLLALFVSLQGEQQGEVSQREIHESALVATRV